MVMNAIKNQDGGSIGERTNEEQDKVNTDMKWLFEER